MTTEVTLKIGAAELRVPAEEAARAYIEKFMLNTLIATTGATSQPTAPAPKIAEPFADGIYAGLTLHENQPMHLILLPDDVDGKTWGAAMDWAIGNDGVLPSRVDSLVLFQNLSSQFKPNWYWTDAPYAGSGAYAWAQNFDDGRQINYHKDNEFRARAVRRLIIQ